MKLCRLKNSKVYTSKSETVDQENDNDHDDNIGDSAYNWFKFENQF